MGADIATRVARGLLAWTVAAVVVRAVLLQPEHCGPATVEEIRASATETVSWAVRTQGDDGRWIYRYDADDDRDLGIYELVRHAGLIMSLYQAQTAGYDDAGDAADRGLRYALTKIIRNTDEAAGWAALGGTDRNAQLATGATALLLAGLAERRAATDDHQHDELMAELGRFLVGQVEPTGAVAGYWDPATGAPVPDRYSPFFTGEAFWALALMHTAFPDDGWDEPARRIAHYLATERDEAEDRFPDIPDHWASYGMAEMTRWPGEEGGAALDDELRAYARKVAQLESMQVRWDSQRTNSTFSRLTRGAQALGAGVGTIGEALGMLWRVPGLDADAVHERATCVAATIVDRQIDATEAESYPNPEMVRGTWLTGGETQIDDQQHSLSALLILLDNIATRENASSTPG